MSVLPLKALCREPSIALSNPALVGIVQDVRDTLATTSLYK
jgi:hypothetical protein